MVVAVEVRGVYGGRIFRGPEDQLAGMHAIACDELIAFCLMSTHFHLVLEVESEDRAKAVVRTIRNRLDRTAPERGVALLDEPHFQVLPDDYAVLRYVAYAHRNPVKAEMVADPLVWAFSSHRDVYGLRSARWFSAERILARMTDRLDKKWLHTQALGRVALPTLRDPVLRPHPVESLGTIASSVAAFFGLRDLHETGAARRCFAAVARFERWPTRSIAAHMARSVRQVNRFQADDTPAVRAVYAVLQDRRLRPTGHTWLEVPAEARGPNLWEAWRESR